MFARSTTVLGDPRVVEAGISFVKDEVLPTVTGLGGCLGVSLLVDRESGRAIATTAWEDRQALDASAELVGPVRARAAEVMHAPLPRVETWEVAAMHREHTATPRAWCRIAWTRSSGVDPDEMIGYWTREVLPLHERMGGFCSASLLVDRESRRGCATMTFDSREALEGSRSAAADVRAISSTRMPVEFLEVAEMELALAHLRIPELV